MHLKKPLIIIPSVLLGSLMIFSLVFMFLSRALLYIPAPSPREAVTALMERDPAIGELYLETEGVTLHGYVINHSDRPAGPWVIYFGGQGDESFQFVPVFREFRNCNFVLFNYRGYGLSTGEPSERNLFHDADTIYDYVRQTLSGNSGRIYIMGFSLGSGVAVSCASRHAVDGLVLIAPFDSVTKVAADRIPEFIVSIFLHETFDSLARVPDVSCPALVFATPGDTVVSFNHTQRLFTAINEPKTLVTLPNVTHGTIIPTEVFRRTIGEFIR